MTSILICLVAHVSSQHVLLGLRFSELSWDHSYPEEEGDSHILWLEFDGEEDGTPVNKLLKIYSKQVSKCLWDPMKFINRMTGLYFRGNHQFYILFPFSTRQLKPSKIPLLWNGNV